MHVVQLLDRFLTNLALDYRFVTLRRMPIPWLSRWAYLPRKYLAILRNRRVVTFLGRPFCYDNRFMPALLQAYPVEIAWLNGFMDFASARTVMDVGANVGQFGFVLKSFFPHLAVCSFEPNPAAFALLSVNASQYPGWTPFPFGLAPTAQSRDFYVVEGKSAQGSVFAENATMNLLSADCRKISVSLEHLSEEVLAARGIPREFDVVKIDVEGAEREVLESLHHVRWRYLYLELSIARGGRTTLEATMELIQRTSGRRPRIVYQQKPAATATHIDVILASA